MVDMVTMLDMVGEREGERGGERVECVDSEVWPLGVSVSSSIVFLDRLMSC